MPKRTHRHAASRKIPPKAIHKHAQPSASKFIDFPIDKLPPEIIHMICIYLKPKDLANLRHVSRLAGPISLRYMVPRFHLIFAKESFEQLKALAAHPIASKYVTSLLFEADRLRVLSRKRWERMVFGPEFVEQVEDVRMRRLLSASERSWRIYNRGLSKLGSIPRHYYTEEEMNRAFEKYLEFVHFQQNSQQEAAHEEELAEAMKHFPRLKELILTINYCGTHRTSTLRKLFEPALSDHYETDAPVDSKSRPLGLQQMRSLLLGAYHAGLNVETLQCGLVSWRILEQDSETFARIRDSVSNAKNLRLEFETEGLQFGHPLAETENRACSSYLEAGRLRNFVTAALNLEHLQIGFQDNDPTWATHLIYIVGEHHWPCLKSINLTMIGATEDDLVSFCSRHASTLKSIQLTSIGFTEGDWFSAFNRIHKVLTLDTIALAGRLDGPNENLDFDENSDEYWPELKEGVEAFFTDVHRHDETDLEKFLDIFMPMTESLSSEFDFDTDDDFW